MIRNRRLLFRGNVDVAVARTRRRNDAIVSLGNVLSVVLLFFVLLSTAATTKTASAFVPPASRLSSSPSSSSSRSWCPLASFTSSALSSSTSQADAKPKTSSTTSTKETFDEFVRFLKERQVEIIGQIEEELESESGIKFGRDPWGMFEENGAKRDDSSSATTKSGGITRVMQGGDVIEKGACSFTLIRDGVLTQDRASTIRSRRGGDAATVRPGDRYSAAALSMVLHTRSPMVPTFRSDVRIFLVQPSTTSEDDDEEDGDGDAVVQQNDGLAWFGGGADLTPYYMFEDDITYFHRQYKDLCDEHLPPASSPSSEEGTNDNDGNAAMEFTYESMKKACDGYFYLPARGEHRGTGGIFFDDMPLVTTGGDNNMDFVKGVVETWMKSWFPVVKRRRNMPYDDRQKQWQMLRRGRYLEFNLLYDRGVKFGLANPNPRVEGIMVSAPPQIAYEYNHVVQPNSDEDKLMKVLKQPREWI